MALNGNEFSFMVGNQKKWAIVYKLSISRNELSNKIIQGNVGSKMKTYFSFTRSYTGSQYIESIKLKKTQTNLLYSRVYYR